MSFLSSLSSEDLKRYCDLVREAISVRRHVDLLRWLQGDVQHFLPHEIMIAAWGDFSAGQIHHDIVSDLPGVRTELSESDRLRQLLCNLYIRWVELGKAPYILGVGDSGFLLDDSLLRCTLSNALQNMRCSMVHGISDERGRHDCLYAIFSSQKELSETTRGAISYLLPYLDTALRQVVHLPRQHSDDSVRAEPDETGQDFGLSQREAEIMDWVRLGKTNAEIGMILNISSFTVKNHLQRIFKKLDVFNRIQAVARFEQGANYA